MNVFVRIKKFFTPYKWETIWTSKADGWVTNFGIRQHKTELVCVVQIDRNKNTFRSYMTNGTIEKECDINWLVANSDELKEILKNNGIKI